jgi:hypothetical protein
MTLHYVITQEGAAYAAVFDEGEQIVGASEALDVDDALDEDELPERAYWSDVGAWLDAEYQHGRAAVLAHRFEVDA